MTEHRRKDAEALQLMGVKYVSRGDLALFIRISKKSH